MKEPLSEEWQSLFRLAESLTGQAYTLQQQSGLLKNNFSRRLRQLSLDSINEYLNYLNENDSEWAHFLSLATIHTTSWFRESPHYKILREVIEKRQFRNKNVFRVMCAASSTGQEAYSLGLLLESFRRVRPEFEYKIDAFDIDPISIETAKRGVYAKASMPAAIWQNYKHLLLVGKNRAEGHFTVSKDIRSRIHWDVGDITSPPDYGYKYDWVMCRNVLIYFNSKKVVEVIKNFKKILNQDGYLCIGHSESFDSEAIGLKLLSNSIYSRVVSKDQVKTPTAEPVVPVKTVTDVLASRVLIVDDSEVIRKKLSKILLSANFEVVEAKDSIEADEKLVKNQIHFITVDYHMPGLDGVSWVKKLRAGGNNIPAVMVSDSTLEDAPQILNILGKEIQDFYDKKTLHSHPEYLVEKAKALVHSSQCKPLSKRKSRSKTKLPDLGFAHADLILIGASTGGTTALVELLGHMNKNCPPVVVVQHITANFSKPFAERLAIQAGLNLGESRHGVKLESGHLYMAHGDYHIGVEEDHGRLTLKTSYEGLVSRHRPSVDFMYISASTLKRKNIVAILMTGMGADGAQGLLQLHRMGAFTACQNEESCIVFGMPKEAIRLGAHKFTGDISELRELINKAIGSHNTITVAA